MLSVLPSSSVSATGARVNLDQDRSRMREFQVKAGSNFPSHGLCIINDSTGGRSIQSSGPIMKPLTTTCNTTTSREYVLSAPHLYRLPPSPTTKASVNSIPLSAINAQLQINNFNAGGSTGEMLTGLNKSSIGIGGRNTDGSSTSFERSRTSEELSKINVGSRETSVAYYSGNSTNSSTISVPTHHFNFPFPNPNVYSRQFIHMKPNYPMMTLSNDGARHPIATTTATAAQVNSCVNPNFDNSLRFSYASPSSTSSNAFPPSLLPPHISLIPQHSLSIPPLMREYPSLPLFTGVYNPPSPVTTSSNSPNNKSPSSVSHRSSLSHHSSSLEISKNGKSVTFERTSSTNCRNNSDEKPFKHRARIQSSENHPKNAGTVAFSTEKHLSSNSISNNANLQHAVHKLYITTPKQPKSSPSLTTPKLFSPTQPPSLPMQPATSQNRHFMVGLNENSGKNCAKIMCSVHFNKGSIIQLPNGSFKCVQDLSIDDFVKSAKESENLQIDSSTVVSIDISNKLENNGMTVTLNLAVGLHREQVSVEASVEQPWFVLGKGWSSCCPSLTLQRFSLSAHQLSVGDVCVSLTRKQNGRHFPITIPKSGSGRKRRYSE